MKHLSNILYLFVTSLQFTSPHCVGVREASAMLKAQVYINALKTLKAMKCVSRVFLCCHLKMLGAVQCSSWILQSRRLGS